MHDDIPSKNNSGFLLGIDAGTTVIKSVIFDLSGNEVSSASSRTTLIYPKPGWVEQDMYEVWESTKKTIKEAIKKAGLSGEDILGISVSAQGGGLWLLDKDKKPVQNAVIWLDSRAAPISKAWEESGLKEKIYEATGYTCFLGAAPIILRWFKDNRREVLDRARYVVWCKDWIKACLTGEICTDLSDPSLGLIDPWKNDYSKKSLELMGISDYEHLLPPIVPSGKIMGRVTRQAAKETGLKEGTPVASGAMDTVSTPLGAGCVNGGDAYSIIGTAGIHGLIVEKPIIDPNKVCWFECHSVPNRWVLGSYAQLATKNLDWFLENFYKLELSYLTPKEAFAVLDDRVKNTPVGSGGVIYLPFLMGERAPFLKPEAKATFFGIGIETKKEHFLRAIYEGVAFSTLHNFEAIENASQMKIDVLRLTGGGSRSEVWSQIISDCLGVKVIVPKGKEFGARGAAINAAVAINLYKDYNDAVNNMVTIERTYTPNAKNHEKYQKLYQIYKKLIASLFDIWTEMSQIS